MTGNGAIPGTCGALKAAPLPVMGADGLRPRRHDSRRWVRTKRDDPRLATARPRVAVRVVHSADSRWTKPRVVAPTSDVAVCLAVRSGDSRFHVPRGSRGA